MAKILWKAIFRPLGVSGQCAKIAKVNPCKSWQCVRPDKLEDQKSPFVSVDGLFRGHPFHKYSKIFSLDYNNKPESYFNKVYMGAA